MKLCGGVIEVVLLKVANDLFVIGRRLSPHPTHIHLKNLESNDERKLQTVYHCALAFPLTGHAQVAACPRETVDAFFFSWGVNGYCRPYASPGVSWFGTDTAVLSPLVNAPRGSWKCDSFLPFERGIKDAKCFYPMQ
ncbi:hypothetical protein CEXT_635721 [Caerostris extrusa]|uniref:C-type lectin domain-containing protein n=1 Tax=Caerostris extrusa TaxID=172846 RepID=A0AAV4RND6_CAEEX|nr:hypothetical protein CEXT_635721 [Caerostris extrusa]